MENESHHYPNCDLYAEERIEQYKIIYQKCMNFDLTQKVKTKNKNSVC